MSSLIIVLSRAIKAFKGHPLARVTSRDGKYTWHVCDEEGGVMLDEITCQSVDRSARALQWEEVDFLSFRPGKLFFSSQSRESSILDHFVLGSDVSLNEMFRVCDSCSEPYA